jgi:hypothetical protein
MGGWKDIEEHHWQQRQAAISIALAAKAIQVCENHDGSLFEGTGDLSYACTVGNAKMNRGEFKDLFASRTEMTDAVKAIINEIALDSCPLCDKMLAD